MSKVSKPGAFRKFTNHRLFKKAASLRVGVACLMVLFVLTLLGTYYQADHGLYAAQERYFTSMVVFLGGWLPVPGAKLVLWIFFFNLLAATLRYTIIWEKAGILLIHYGILFLLISSFIIHYFAQESVIVLEEGESVNISRDYHKSELALYTESATKSEDKSASQNGSFKRETKREILAIDTESLEEGVTVRFSGSANLEITPIYFYEHSMPNSFQTEGVENVSEFTTLDYQPPPTQREAIAPGGLFEINSPGWEKSKRVLLWEREINAFPLTIDGREYFIRIQRKGYPLPFQLELIKFIKRQHLGTQIAKSFESDVLVKMPHAQTEEIIPRETKIFMNNPLRTDGYTLFQASFSMDEVGNKQSVFATVKNDTYYVPYIASSMVGIGIIFHFIVMYLKRRKRFS